MLWKHRPRICRVVSAIASTIHQSCAEDRECEERYTQSCSNQLRNMICARSHSRCSSQSIGQREIHEAREDRLSLIDIAKPIARRQDRNASGENDVVNQQRPVAEPAAIVQTHVMT